MPNAKTLLLKLGSGASAAEACAAAGLPAEQFPDWWRREIEARVPEQSGTRPADVRGRVTITRNEWGIPRIVAQSADDLFFGFGYATAQDRMFQLDYLRRRALGRLAEILGPEGLESDVLARTVGLHRIAEREWEQLPDGTRQAVEAYTHGINAYLDESRERPAIEFDLLGYTPEPWRPQDCIAIEGEFRWYLTGRFPVIVIPEIVKRAIGDGPLYHAFLSAEADDECILPRDTTGQVSNLSASKWDARNSGSGDGDGTGSNNWVIAGRHTATGKPIVASDPHIAFAAVSCWHEVHLQGGGYNVVGMSYTGIPAVMFGRNERVAWGCTNNICSLRDLYQEKTDAAHPGCFLHAGRWEPAQERTETIHVKGQAPVRKSIRSSRNGPIVDEILPAAARETGPVSLRWLGAEHGGWLTALLGMDRARSAEEFREATRPWHVPTFCLVFADVEGHIGFQCTGRIPIRKVSERGYRPGWDPAHQWDGLIPFEAMPAVMDPAQGLLVTANNRVTHEFPYPLSGTWISGHRAKRIRDMLEAYAATGKVSVKQCSVMHQDAMSLRAVECLPMLLAILSGVDVPRVRLAVSHLAAWDAFCEPDRVGCTLFNVFFQQWCRAIAEERFAGPAAELVASSAQMLASRLLCEGDSDGWFHSTPRDAAVVAAFERALDQLTGQFGPDVLNWSWGRLHTLQQKHILSGRGELGRWLDCGGVPVRGDMATVCNTGSGPNFEAATGAGYRMIADLADPQAGLHAIDAGSESGHPGSPHYADQLLDWQTGRYHHLPLTGALTAGMTTRVLEPAR